MYQDTIKQKPIIIWFTGLSASGKSTLSNALEIELNSKGYKTYTLDEQDRDENIREVAQLAQKLLKKGVIVITAFISPFKKDRKFARSLVKKGEFIEIFVDTPLEICEKRDSNGVYKKARAGEIEDFIYERPRTPEIKITRFENINENVSMIISYIELFTAQKE